MNTSNLYNRDLLKTKIKSVYDFIIEIKKVKPENIESLAEISSKIEIQKLFSEYKAIIINDVMSSYGLYEMLYDDFIFIIDHYHDKKEIMKILGLNKTTFSKYYNRKMNMSFKKLTEFMQKLTSEINYLK